MRQTVEQVEHTVAGLLESGALAIGEASDTPELDARMLLQTLLSKDHAWLIAHGTELVDRGNVQQFREWTRRRAKSEPVAYITERKAFWTLDLRITPDVLVPRPETELLLELALDKIPLSESVTVLDLGTGSGAVGLGIATERPLCKVVATDCSRAALKIAEQNKSRLGLRSITFRRGNWYDPLGDDRFAVIVCNPPYVPDSHYAAALSYEPREALFSGSRGLDALQQVVGKAGAWLEARGWLLVEHGFDQKTEVQSLFEAAGFDSITTGYDHAGHPRVTTGRLTRA